MDNNIPKINLVFSPAAKIVDDDDCFGFSLVSEDELKQQEEQLKKVVEHQSLQTAQIAATSQQLTTALQDLHAMIMPLLNNLRADPAKHYIFWPDRVQKITKFQDKINNLVNNALTPK